jgi:hypothetical protein
VRVAPRHGKRVGAGAPRGCFNSVVLLKRRGSNTHTTPFFFGPAAPCRAVVFLHVLQCLIGIDGFRLLRARGY